MPGLLSRSKSMRLLKGHRNQTNQHDSQKSMPWLGASKTHVDRDQTGTPVSREGEDLESPNMAVRPSTSGGLGGDRIYSHMKTNPVSSMHTLNDLASEMPSTLSTALYNPEATDSSEGIIGIALGSPTVGAHRSATPPATTIKAASQSTDNMSAYTRPYSPAPSTARIEAPKSKLGRWKSLFRKAVPAPPEPEKPAFYQLTTTITATRAVRADSHHDEEPTKSTEQRVNGRDIGRTPSPPTFKPNIRASRAFTSPRTVPERPHARARALTAGTLPANPRVSVFRSATNLSSSSDVGSDLPAVPKLAVSKSTQELSLAAGAKPMLDVSIPDIKLDRYSVMFGNLLQSNSNRSSSLLVRRQGNSEKLKPLNKLLVKGQEQESSVNYKLQRRATSPIVPSPSPRLSLFPSTSNSRATSPRSSSVPRSKVLQRAKTTHDKSPLHQTFTRKDMDSNKGQQLFIQKSTATPNLKSQSSMNLQVQQLAITPSSAGSFESDTDSITLVVGRASPSHPRKLHLDDREPEWEIVSKPPVVARSNTTPAPSLVRTNSQAKVNQLSALYSHPTSAPLDASSPLQRIQRSLSPPASARQASSDGQAASETRTDGGDNAPKAMVGVARSVSVSRANSPRTLVRTATAELRSPGDRYVERATLTPTMVEVKNRKSHRGQLVDE